MPMKISGVCVTPMRRLLLLLPPSFAQIIQAASRRRDRWYPWTRQFEGSKYVMDIWTDDELALLAYVTCLFSNGYLVTPI
jgi:hypothetical protein